VPIHAIHPFIIPASYNFIFIVRPFVAGLRAKTKTHSQSRRRPIPSLLALPNYFWPGQTQSSSAQTNPEAGASSCKPNPPAGSAQLSHPTASPTTLYTVRPGLPSPRPAKGLVRSVRRRGGRVHGPRKAWYRQRGWGWLSPWPHESLVSSVRRRGGRVHGPQKPGAVGRSGGMAKSMARESLGIIGRGRGGAESTADEAYVNTVPAKPG